MAIAVEGESSVAGLCWEDDRGYREGIYSILLREGSMVVLFLRPIVKNASGWKARVTACVEQR